MENIPILKDLVILMAASIPLTILFHRFGQPAIIGFLITGALIGPYGAALVTKIEAVEHLAQIGVVLLLFVVGLEFSMARIFRLRREGVLGGGLQVVGSSVIVFIITRFFGLPDSQCLMIGFVTALSSTAIVLKQLTDRGEIDTPQGNLAIGILIFQDLCIVPMLLIIQVMGGQDEASFLSILRSLVLAAAAIVVILSASSYIVPYLLKHVVKLRNREVFIMTILLLCFGTAWLTSKIGLSLALGAFIAGLVISESDYSHEIVAEVVIFRDTFLSLFFISIGMLLDINYFINNLPALVSVAAGIMILKVIIIIIIGQILKYPLRLSIIVGMALAQVGEFSFVLLKLGKDMVIISQELYQTNLAASIITMAATPFLINKGHDVSMRTARLLKIRSRPTDIKKEPALKDHVIIVGYGLNGRNLARVLKEVGIKFIVLDLNWDRIKQARNEGCRAVFGDSSQKEILNKVGIEQARMLVIAISDPIITRHTLKITRESNGKIYILVRTRYINEVEDLYKLGANQVIPEEFETSIEIFSRVLKEYHVPGNIINNQIDLIRHEGYAMLRTPSMKSEKLMEITSILADSVTETFFVKENSHLAGKTLSQIDIRKKSGALVLAVVRKSSTRTNPPADYQIEAGDILAIIGSHAEMDKAMHLLRGTE